MTRQQTGQISAIFLVFFLTISLIACKSEKTADSETTANEDTTAIAASQKEVYQPFFKLSLAQWSVHRMIQDEGMDPFDFPAKAADWGFEGVEYVSQLYDDAIAEAATPEEGVKAVVERLKSESKEAGVTNLIIMIDGEGDLSVNSEAERNQAVENHKKWVDAAAALGCHSIRINLFGSFDRDEWKANSIDGLSKLGAYAKTKNVNVLVENHGWLSSDAPLLMEVINAVGMDNCGTLPDFGNFCVKRKDFEKWGECVEEYPDIYQGVSLMMPAAMAVSAKSHDFDALGNESEIDYSKMLAIVKDAGYTGFIGVEYEGDNLSEAEGIMATKNLLLAGGKFEE